MHSDTLDDPRSASRPPVTSARTKLLRWAGCTAIAVVAIATLSGAASRSGSLGAFHMTALPAGPGAVAPCLATDPDGRTYASWLEPRARGGHALMVAKLDGMRWSKPRVAAQGDSFFVNWADTPVLAAGGGKRLAVSWPWKSGADTYAYDVRIAQSHDDGATWSAPVTPHRDATPTEHGFVSLLVEGESIRAVWLDGRKNAETKAGDAGHGEHEGGEMTVRTAVIRADGRLDAEQVLDERACDCCPTSLARTAAATLVAYRDRSGDEIRDMSLVRLDKSRWSEPYPLHRDGWKMPGCPVNGPALDAVGNKVVVAWFTGAGDGATVYFARSDDGGRSFGEPQRVDPPGDGTGPIGRVDILLREDGAALVSWMQGLKNGAQIRVREFGRDGRPGRAVVLAQASSSRKSGIPRMARSGEAVVFAWTEAGTASRVRTAVAEWKW